MSIGSCAVSGSLALRLVPMLVKYSLKWFTILFLSVQQFPSEVIHLSFIIVFLFLDFKTSLIVLHVFLQSFLNIA